ncbi:hypothetical protein [Agrobacterium rubi]|nr:hypothetical protein [Agrobacterium rubi]MBP1877888.1 hypothetical protein [Agrobacterium rubi]
MSLPDPEAYFFFLDHILGMGNCSNALNTHAAPSKRSPPTPGRHEGTMSRMRWLAQWTETNRFAARSATAARQHAPNRPSPIRTNINLYVFFVALSPSVCDFIRVRLFGGFSMLGSLKSAFSAKPLNFKDNGKVSATASAKGKYDKKDAPLSVTDIVATCLDVAFGTANGGSNTGYAALGQSVSEAGRKGYQARGNAGISVPPNPYVVAHGHSSGDVTSESPVTLKYMQRRRYKEIGGQAVSISGSVSIAAAMGALPINVISLTKQVNSTVSTVSHLTQLKLLANRVDAAHHGSAEGVTLSNLIAEVIKMKAHKSGIQGAKMATAAVPVLGEIVTASVNAGINGAASAVKTFDKAFHAKSCARLALEIHWLAYQEQFSAYCRARRLNPDDFLVRDDYLARSRPPRLKGMNLRQANEALRTAEKPPRLTGMGLSQARQALEEHCPPAARLPSSELRALVKEARNSFYFNRSAGPATELFSEIFKRRSVLAVLGSYDVGALIMEPGGWVALTDKIASL